MKKITMEVRDGKVKLSSNTAMRFPDFLAITLTGILEFAKHITTDEKSKGKIYDDMNQAFSNLLELYAPEYELRPDLTVDAIKAMEDKLLDENYKKKSQSQS